MIILVTLPIYLGLYVWYLWSLARLFPKIGLDGVHGWIPIYNEWKLLDRGGFPGGLVLLMLVPFLGFIAVWVLRTIAIHRINTEHGMGGGYTVLGALVPPLWATLLGSALAFRVESFANRPEHNNFSYVYSSPSSMFNAQPTQNQPQAQSPQLTGPSASSQSFTRPQPPSPQPTQPPAAQPQAFQPYAQPQSSDSAITPPQQPTTPPRFEPYPGSSGAQEPEAPTPPRSIFSPQPTSESSTETPSNATPIPPSPEPSDRNLVAERQEPAPPTTPIAPPTASPTPDPAAATPTTHPTRDGFDAAFTDRVNSEEPLVLPPTSSFAPPAPAAEPQSFEPGERSIFDTDKPVEEEPEDDATIVVTRRSRAKWVLELPNGDIIPLHGEEIVVGRKPGARPHAVTIPDETRTLSKVHARLTFDDGWKVEDLGSTNGVAVFDENGVPTDIVPGDLVPVEGTFLLGTLEVKLREND